MPRIIWRRAVGSSAAARHSDVSQRSGGGRTADATVAIAAAAFVLSLGRPGQPTLSLLSAPSRAQTAKTRLALQPKHTAAARGQSRRVPRVNIVEFAGG
jgi:hypothetical protein